MTTAATTLYLQYVTLSFGTCGKKLVISSVRPHDSIDVLLSASDATNVKFNNFPT